MSEHSQYTLEVALIAYLIYISLNQTKALAGTFKESTTLEEII